MSKRKCEECYLREIDEREYRNDPMVREGKLKESLVDFTKDFCAVAAEDFVGAVVETFKTGRIPAPEKDGEPDFRRWAADNRLTVNEFVEFSIKALYDFGHQHGWDERNDMRDDETERTADPTEEAIATL